MKHWQDTTSALERMLGLTSGSRAALATVVRIEGSAYRRPGAKLVVDDRGSTWGSVSGGCLEADVRERALEVIRSGIPVLRHYDTGPNDSKVWGLGLGCEGSVDVFIQPASDPILQEVHLRLSELLSTRTACVLTTFVAGPHVARTHIQVPAGIEGTGGIGDAALDGAIGREAAGLFDRGESKLLELGPHRVFIETLTPPPHLVIFGAGDDARPLAQVADQVGFDVTVVDHRPAYLAPERFPQHVRCVLRRATEGVAGLGLGRRHFAVVQTHALDHDREWMRALLREPLAYLGLLGPRSRKAALLRELGVEGEPAQLFAPVGLDLGAEGPEQIAISIVAEALAVYAGRSPDHLRARGGGIHAP
ncbi:MAG TPA: XdhC family protein [Anaeromyxobacteraceae bacterium]|nr:XdhC family protein [Anaeromyxobacteraceae bacterium]